MSDRLTLAATFSILATALFALTGANGALTSPDQFSSLLTIRAGLPKVEFTPGKLLPSLLR